MIHQIISDIHLDFHCDNGISYAKSLSGNADVLIIAGDLFTGTSYRPYYPFMDIICAKYSHIVYVTGNHEYYWNTPEHVTDELDAICNKYHNFNWLDKSSVVINTQRYIGCTLWFQNKKDHYKYESLLNDFNLIRNFKPWVYEENERCIKYITSHMSKDDIVVVHHLPSYRSVAPIYSISALNRFFVCDIESDILEVQPKLFIHGHSHESMDYMLDNTRVICNPFGYVGEELNDKYNEECIVKM